MRYKSGHLFVLRQNMDRLWQTPMGQVLRLMDELLQDKEVVTLVQHRYPVGKGQSGNRCYDPMILLRMWVVMMLHGLSEVETEQMVLANMLFQEFCGLTHLPVPDHSTLSRFKKRLGQSELNGCGVCANDSCRDVAGK